MPIDKHMPERRLEGRLLCADMVDVEWKDKSGWLRTSTALLEDISSSGACLQMDVPIPARSVVHIRHSKGALPGEVRYCSFRDIGYFVGLQFAEEQKWSRRLFRPKHVLDLQKMKVRKAAT